VYFLLFEIFGLFEELWQLDLRLLLVGGLRLRRVHLIVLYEDLVVFGALSLRAQYLLLLANQAVKMRMLCEYFGR